MKAKILFLRATLAVVAALFTSLASASDPGTWALTGSMTTVRENHTATLLPNGKVLVAGGQTAPGDSLASAELYDPRTGEWTTTSSMGEKRTSSSATLLPSGKVLVVGGFADSMDPPGTLASAEMFDPATGSWKSTGSMHEPRCGHSAVLITAGPLSGKVLVAGGGYCGGDGSSTAELYDPDTGKWSYTGSLLLPRYWERTDPAMTFPDGSVLIVGGATSDSSGYIWPNEAELFDPVTQTWAATEKTTDANGPTVLLQSGSVLVAGGNSTPRSVAAAELFQPSTGAWTPTSSMAFARYVPSLTRLANGRVLVAGGDGYGWGGCETLSSAELYDPQTGNWTETGSMRQPRYASHTATLLPSGQVLVAGGVQCGGTGPLSSAELYTPVAGTTLASTSRLSLTNGGRQANGDSFSASVSADGRYVVFASNANNLVSGDTNGATDIFLRDRLTQVTQLVSRGRNGVPANGDSLRPVISADGHYVAFESYATNLGQGADPNSAADIFRYDRISGAMMRVSVTSKGDQAVKGDSITASISDDGSHIAYASAATNLVGNDHNQRWDIFVRDIVKGKTIRASVGPGKQEGDGDALMPSISGDDHWVAFVSYATKLIDGDSNGKYDVFVRDLAQGITTRVSIGTGETGVEANGDSWQPHISTDGRYVVFASDASNLVRKDKNRVADIFLRDRTENTTYLKSLADNGSRSDGHSYHPKVSPDGRFVVFESYGTLVSGDTNSAADIYLHSGGKNGKTRRISVSTDGVGGDVDSLAPVMSSDGRYIVFESLAPLVTGDTNLAWDIFVRDQGVGSMPTYPLSTQQPVNGAR